MLWEHEVTVKEIGCDLHESTKDNSEKIGIIMSTATLLTQLCMSLQSRNNGNMSDFFNMKIIVYGYLLSLVCSCSVHVLDIAALIHIVRSVRAASFNYYIHMHLVPYLKSQITPQ